MKVVWELSVDEAYAIVELLGSLPTKQGAYPLYERLKAESDAQVKQQQPEVATND